MPLTKRRSPPRRKDRRERSRSFSPYTRRESRHHTDDYHAYSRPSQSRSTSANQAYHRSRSPVGHMTSAPSPAGGARSHARRNQYSPSARHEVRSSREHPQRSFSPPPRHSSLSSPKQRSRSPMWSASRQVVPTIGSMEFAHSDTSFKKSTLNQSGRRSQPSSYENTSTSSYSARKMSPSSRRYTSDTYPPSGTQVPEDNYSRIALGKPYLQSNARCSLSERFKIFDPVESFHYDENITIGIHRGIQGPPGSPRPVRRDFNPYNFVMIRQKTEGSPPIFDREELRQYRYDEMEEDPDDFRVVTVASTNRDDYVEGGATDSSYNVGYRSPPRPGGPPSYQWNDDEQYGYKRHTRDDFDNSRSFVGQSDNRERWMSESRMRNIGSSSHRYGGSESVYAPDRGEPRNWERLERVQHNPDDLRHSIGPRYSSRKKSGFPEGSYYDGDYESKGRDSKYSKNSPERLPDFSKRPDKYQYEEWREHPEMVPRGSNYYEHDTRPEVDMMPSQSRGTGRFRSRKDGLLPHPFRPFRSRGTFKPRLTTHSFTTRRTFGSRTLDRFRTRSRGNISLRNRPRGRGVLSDPPAAGSDWKESSFGKSSEKSASDK